MVADLRKEAEHDRPCSRRQPADVVAEPGARGSKKRGKEGRKIHCEEAKDALADSDRRKHPEQPRLRQRRGVGGEHGGEVGDEE